MAEELEIDGGKIEELLCSEMWYRGKVEEPANVIHIKVNGNWHRLYFDYGIIFWRRDKEGPKEYEMPEYESHFKVVDVGRKYNLVNNFVESVTGRAVPRGSEILFRLTNGRLIKFSNVEDYTTYIA